MLATHESLASTSNYAVITCILRLIHQNLQLVSSSIDIQKNQLRTSPPPQPTPKNHSRHKSTAPSPRKCFSQLSRDISALISLSHSLISPREIVYSNTARFVRPAATSSTAGKVVAWVQVTWWPQVFFLLLDLIRIFHFFSHDGNKIFSSMQRITWSHCKVLPRSSLGAAAKSMYGRATEFFNAVCSIVEPHSGRHSSFFSGSLYCVWFIYSKLLPHTAERLTFARCHYIKADACLPLWGSSLE